MDISMKYTILKNSQKGRMFSSSFSFYFFYFLATLCDSELFLNILNYGCLFIMNVCLVFRSIFLFDHILTKLLPVFVLLNYM